MKNSCPQTDIGGQTLDHMHLLFSKQRNFMPMDQRIGINGIGLLRFDGVFIPAFHCILLRAKVMEKIISSEFQTMFLM